MQLIGIDLGTTYIKGGILNLDKLDVEHVTRRPFPSPPPGLPPLHHEVDPDAVIAATRDLIAELAARQDAARDCAGILVSSQMHGFLLTDASGTPLTRGITWLDQRALTPPNTSGAAPTPFTALQESLSQDEILELGNGFKVSLPLCALYTLAAHDQLPTESSAPSEPAVVWSLSDYVLARLCNEGVAEAAARTVAEPTLAASFGAFDFATGAWRTELLDRLGLGNLIWPRLVSAHEPVGALQVGNSTVPVYPALGDHQCSTLGSLLQPGELALNISTGSQVSTLADHWNPSADFESRPYFGGRTLNTVTRVPAGRALNGLVRLLTEIPRLQGIALDDPWPTLAQAVASVEATPEADLAVNLSFFAGAFGDSGSITNIREENLTIGHLFHAAFRHMAENYAQCAAWLGWQSSGPEGPEDPAGPDPSHLVFSGGLAQNFPSLRTAVAQQLRAPYRMSPHAEDALLGLLILGLVHTGRAADVDSANAQVRERLAT